MTFPREPGVKKNPPLIDHFSYEQVVLREIGLDLSLYNAMIGDMDAINEREAGLFILPGQTANTLTNVIRYA